VDPRLAADIRVIVGSQSYADPEPSRHVGTRTCRRQRTALIAGAHPKTELPSERTIRRRIILNRMKPPPQARDPERASR